MVGKVAAKERAFAREAARDMGPLEQRGVATATLFLLNKNPACAGFLLEL